MDSTHTLMVLVIDTQLCFQEVLKKKVLQSQGNKRTGIPKLLDDSGFTNLCAVSLYVSLLKFC